MPTVAARHGDIFEGGADVTVLPCSGKATVSSATRRWAEVYGFPLPETLKVKPKLGAISKLITFNGPAHRSKFVVYAASVLNDSSTPDVIESIGRALGALTVESVRLRLIDTPLLGTGAGRLSADQSARSLARGFAATAHSDAVLQVFGFAENYKAASAALASVRKQVWEAVDLKPGYAGISVDLKELMKILLKKIKGLFYRRR
jgi:hypothetical protein